MKVLAIRRLPTPTPPKEGMRQARCKVITRIILCVSLFAFILCSETTFAAKEIELPKYDCVWIDKDLEIDGLLNEPDWNKAQEVELLITDTEEKPDNPTRVKLL